MFIEASGKPNACFKNMTEFIVNDKCFFSERKKAQMERLSKSL